MREDLGIHSNSAVASRVSRPEPASRKWLQRKQLRPPRTLSSATGQEAVLTRPSHGLYVLLRIGTVTKTHILIHRS